MSNLETRLAEIRRRSEAYIQKRKQRRRIFLACVLPMLCICLLVGAWQLQRNFEEAGYSRDMAAENAPAEQPNQMAAGGKETLYPPLSDSNEAESGHGVKAITVSTEGVSHTVTDREQLMQLEALLDTLEKAYQMQETNDSAQSAVEESVADNSLHGSCTFTVTRQGAEPVEYTLSGSRLYRGQTGQEYPLTDAQLTQLKQLLDILTNR